MADSGKVGVKGDMKRPADVRRGSCVEPRHMGRLLIMHAFLFLCSQSLTQNAAKALPLITSVLQSTVQHNYRRDAHAMIAKVPERSIPRGLFALHSLFFRQKHFSNRVNVSFHQWCSRDSVMVTHRASSDIFKA